MRHPLLLAALIVLGACGTRGSLTLPPGPAPAPILGNQEPAGTPQAPSAARRGGDLNTATKAAG